MYLWNVFCNISKRSHLTVIYLEATLLMYKITALPWTLINVKVWETLQEWVIYWVCFCMLFVLFFRGTCVLATEKHHSLATNKTKSRSCDRRPQSVWGGYQVTKTPTQHYNCFSLRIRQFILNKVYMQIQRIWQLKEKQGCISHQ